MARNGIRFIALLLLLAGAAPEARAQAGDLDLLSGSAPPPNVMLFLDNSNSMNTSVPGDPLGRNRFQVGAAVLRTLVTTLNPPDGMGGYNERIRFGFAAFVTPDPSGSVHAPLHPTGFNSSLNDGPHCAGARLWVPIKEGNTKQILDAINTLEHIFLAHDVHSGGTCLSEALVDLGRYFAQNHVFGSYPTDLTARRARYESDSTKRIKPMCDPPDCPSPIDSACRKNFVIFITDGKPERDLNDHWGVAVPGTTARSTFMNTIGNFDGDSNECGVPVLACPNAPTTGRDDGQTYSIDKDGTDWFDDVALYLFTRDLAPGIEGLQNVITYPIGFAVDHPLLQETAQNGGGVYYTVQTADAFLQALLAVTQNIFDRLVSFSAPSVPTSRSSFGDGFYSAYFEPQKDDSFWPGHLEAYRLSPQLQVLDRFGLPALDPTTKLFKEPRRPFWDAGLELAKLTHPPRKLYTTLGAARQLFNPATISAAHLGVVATDLPLYPKFPTISFATTELLADGLVDYLTGKDVFDKDGDGNRTELRDAVLGDIFHSAPISIGTPSIFLSGETGYGPAHDATSFLGRYKKRDRAIYVGANDGMLHGFAAGKHRTGDNPATPEIEKDYYDLGTGQELFGYVPGFLLPKLKFVPRNTPRQYYYVDGSPAAADVWLPSSPTDATKDPDEWATVLVTGMRQGGDGYVALDVTDPSATTGPHGPYPKLLWEVSGAGIPLGDTWSEPIMARVKLKAGSTDLCGKVSNDDGPCREQWVAIFGGGYRADGDPNLLSYISDPNNASWSSKSKGIFMVTADTGKLIGRAAFSPTPGAITNAMRFSIPSTPAVLDLNFDGFADVVYVGDLGGQLWRWDISTVGQDTVGGDGIMDNWPVGLFFKSDPVSIGGGVMRYRSIFFPPVATYMNGKLVLAFGSGERAQPTYMGSPTADDNNRFWVARDRVRLGVNPADPNSGWLTLREGNAMVNGSLRHLNNVTNLATDPVPDDDGYYVVVPDGEKFITNHILYGGVLLTLTYVPINSNTNVCERYNTTNVWAFNLENAGGLVDETAAPGNPQRRKFLGPGAPTDPRISITQDKVILIGQTSAGNVFEFDVPVTPPPPVELVFWRQLY